MRHMRYGLSRSFESRLNSVLIMLLILFDTPQ